MSENRLHVQHYYSVNSGATPSPDNLYLGEIAINVADEKIMFKNVNDEIVEISTNDCLKITTYSELKTLRDNSELKPGTFYRITDYETMTYASGTKSAGHPFDVIVLALSENTLSEEAYAIKSERDTDNYFGTSNLSAWKIWYCLDNDASRFEWMGATCPVNNPTLKGVSPEYFIYVDGNDDEIMNYAKNEKYESEDIFYWYGYENDDEGNNTLVLYKTDIKGIPHDNNYINTDYADVFFYQGTEVYDGIVYDKWRKIESGNEYAWDYEYKAFVLTEQIVENNSIKEEYLYNAESIDGKGVIYRMIDEYGNDCPYDFKNIQFNDTSGKKVNSSNCSINASLVDGNSFNEPFTPVAYMFIDTNGNNTNYGDADRNTTDLFYEYGYETTPDGLDKQLCLFKSDTEIYEEEGTDYEDKFFYWGTYDYDGETYDMWKKAELGVDEVEWAEREDIGRIFILTNRMVEGEVIVSGVAGMYTFTWVDENNESYDASILGNDGTLKNDEDEIGGVYNNIIGKYVVNGVNKLPRNLFISTYTHEDGTFYTCNNNVLGNNCYNNTFGNNCYNNTFGNDCQYNTFGNGCDNNTFGNGCENNTLGRDCGNNIFGDYCHDNTFGRDCGNNIFGDKCTNNTFGNGCDNNTFGDNCRFNTFGNSYFDNTFGNGCYYNTFGNNCDRNTFGNICHNNTFDNGCYDNTLGDDCTNNTFGNDCYNNTIGNYCSYNIFGYNCTNNTFGSECYNNTFGNNCGTIDSGNTLDIDCTYNQFGNYCYNITFGNYCDNNTFGYECNSNTFGNGCYNNTFGNECNSNTFGNHCDNNIFGNNCNDITFDNQCYANIFGNSCENNTFGNTCGNNTFGNECNSNTFGNGCYDNTFGDYCHDNTFGYHCYNNTFGNDCDYNIFGRQCHNNTFGNYCGKQNNGNTLNSGCTYNQMGDKCYNNTFGNDCTNNTFGNECNSNTFGNDCTNNTFGNECNSNTFGNGCAYNTFGDICYNNTFGDECENNTLGRDCGNNIFGDYCHVNTFGNDCVDNTFGEVCYKNTFGIQCHNNTFGNNCTNNTFGDNCGKYNSGNTLNDDCTYNQMGDKCCSITFGENCGYNILGNNCTNNTFGNSCYNNTIDIDCYHNTFDNHCYDNTLGRECGDNTFGDSCCNNIFGYSCTNNTFSNNCHYNTFGDNCIVNSFIDGSGNTRSYCSNNTFEDNCSYNKIITPTEGSSESVLQNLYIHNGFIGNSESNLKETVINKINSVIDIDIYQDENGETCINKTDCGTF